MTDTSPEIAPGLFVEWADGKGLVDLVVKSGTVPGVADPAIVDSPSARVVIWENGQRTEEKVAVPVESLTPIAPLDGDDEIKTGYAAIIDMQAKHAEHVADAGLGSEATVTALAAKSAYERGLASYPGTEATVLTDDEWARGRVERLIKVALAEEAVTNDLDLLDPEHPLAETVEPPADDEVTIAAGDVARTLRDIERDAAEAGLADEEKALDAT